MMDLKQRNLVLIFLVVAIAEICPAAPGDLDLAFGTGGRVMTPGPNGWTRALDVAVQPDGKILILGDDYPLIVVARYHANGILDTTFGSGGIASMPGYEAGAFKLLADGKILVVGTACNAITQCDFLIARLLENGSVDNSFDGDGRVTIDFGSHDFATDVAVGVGGKIVATGGTGVINSRNYDFAVASLGADGALDTTFDGDGRKVTSLGDYSDWGPQGVVVQPDGKIIVAGERGVGPGYSPTDFALVRYNTDGSLDSSFSGDGVVFTNVETWGEIFYDVVLLPDGRIVGIGHSVNYATLIRYKPDGTLDNSFGVGGIKATDIGVYDFFVSGALQPDGRLVVSGYNGQHVVARFNVDGSLDTTFGGNGIVTTTFDNMGYPFAYGACMSVALQPDGKIVGAGNWGLDGEFQVIAIARYRGDRTSTRFDFDGDSKADISVFRPSNGTWYLERSSQGVASYQFGLTTDEIAPADFDGDEKTDISVFREGAWWFMKSSDATVSSIQFGAPGDVPVPAEYNGDGLADLAVYRDGAWWAHDLATGDTSVVSFGTPLDKPVVADYDGDGRADQAVYRNGEWHINRSSGGHAVIRFGLATDIPVTADYDGDARSDLAVYRDGEWHVYRSTTGYTVMNFGLGGDVPAPADYDGDGKADPAVYRSGTWYLLKSASGFSAYQFGLAGDIPIASAFLP